MMRIDLQHNDGHVDQLQVDDNLITGCAMIHAGDKYFLFEGYVGGFAHVARFLQCNAPLQIALNHAKQGDGTPQPVRGRSFFGQKSKGHDNG